jgi:hypothetical protein
MAIVLALIAIQNFPLARVPGASWNLILAVLVFCIYKHNGIFRRGLEMGKSLQAGWA